jgi:mycoredoxin
MVGKEEQGMTQPLTMYTTPWCGYCRRLKSQLAREGIEITEVDIEREPDAAEYVMTVNGGYQTVPTVLFPDGSTLTNPSVHAIKQRLEELAAPICPN